jgi:hypothetical protein
MQVGLAHRQAVAFGILDFGVGWNPQHDNIPFSDRPGSLADSAIDSSGYVANGNFAISGNGDPSTHRSSFIRRAFTVIRWYNGDGGICP